MEMAEGPLNLLVSEEVGEKLAGCWAPMLSMVGKDILIRSTNEAIVCRLRIFPPASSIGNIKYKMMS